MVKRWCLLYNKGTRDTRFSREKRRRNSSWILGWNGTPGQRLKPHVSEITPKWEAGRFGENVLPALNYLFCGILGWQLSGWRRAKLVHSTQLNRRAPAKYASLAVKALLQIRPNGQPLLKSEKGWMNFASSCAHKMWSSASSDDKR